MPGTTELLLDSGLTTCQVLGIAWQLLNHVGLQLNMSLKRLRTVAEVQPMIAPFYDGATGAFCYVIHDGPGSYCAVIDAVLDFDAESCLTCTRSADKLIAFIRRERLHCLWLLETHAAASALSASSYLQSRLGGKIGIGQRMRTVRHVSGVMYEAPPDIDPACHRLFAAGESFGIGRLNAKTLPVPGAPSSELAYQVGEWVFMGNMPNLDDRGRARHDFTERGLATLHRSAS